MRIFHLKELVLFCVHCLHLHADGIWICADAANKEGVSFEGGTFCTQCKLVYSYRCVCVAGAAAAAARCGGYAGTEQSNSIRWLSKLGRISFPEIINTRHGGLRSAGPCMYDVTRLVHINK